VHVGIEAEFEEILRLFVFAEHPRHIIQANTLAAARAYDTCINLASELAIDTATTHLTSGLFEPTFMERSWIIANARILFNQIASPSIPPYGMSTKEVRIFIGYALAYWTLNDGRIPEIKYLLLRWESQKLVRKLLQAGVPWDKQKMLRKILRTGKPGLPPRSLAIIQQLLLFHKNRLYREFPWFRKLL
jgi:hypothetical protein